MLVYSTAQRDKFPAELLMGNVPTDGDEKFLCGVAVSVYQNSGISTALSFLLSPGSKREAVCAIKA